MSPCGTFLLRFSDAGQARYQTNARLAGRRPKPAEKETAGEGTRRAALGISGRTGGRFFVQPERYGTKIADWGKVTLLRL
jgi:hypothetical protein